VLCQNTSSGQLANVAELGGTRYEQAYACQKNCLIGMLFNIEASELRSQRPIWLAHGFAYTDAQRVY
jgi:hypothetical protein